MITLTKFYCIFTARLIFSVKKIDSVNMDRFNVSEKQILDRLNSEEIAKYMGGIVFICVLMIFGLIGNSHVLFVFACKFKSSNHTTFICCLGIVDMIACTIGMPLTIMDLLLHPLTFHSRIICKIGLNINYFVCVSSALILLVITVDRYRKICHPMEWQLSNRRAKIACVITICVSFGISLPTFFFFGLRTIETRYANITGVKCSTDDDYITTNVPVVFNVVLTVFAAIAFVALIVLYISISRVIMGRGVEKYSIRKQLAHRRHTEPVLSISTIAISAELPELSHSLDTTETLSTTINATHSPSACSRHDQVKYKINVKNQTTLLKETKRKTIIFFFIVTIYFCSYLPDILLTIFSYTNSEFFDQLCNYNAVAYNTFKWFFFVNNVANPVVYLFLDVKFRAEIKSFYCNVCK